MLETSRSYSLKLDKVLVPMLKGGASRHNLDLAFDLCADGRCEITALAVKDELHDPAWSDKVAVVTSAYREGKERNIKVVPRVRTSRSVKECIVDEANSHRFDLVLVLSERRASVSATLFESTCEFVLKKSRVPVAIMKVLPTSHQYRTILFPVSETVSTRAAAYFALQLTRASGARLFLADLRRYDSNPVHGFSQLFDSLGIISEKYAKGVDVIRGNSGSSLSEEVSTIANQNSVDAIVLGVRPDAERRVRINSELKNALRESKQDVILVKK